MDGHATKWGVFNAHFRGAFTGQLEARVGACRTAGGLAAWRARVEVRSDPGAVENDVG